MKSDNNYGFTTETISDNEWNNLDFKVFKVPENEIPSCPTKWAINKTRTLFFLPLKPGSHMERDGAQNSIFLSEAGIIKIRLSFYSPFRGNWIVPKEFNRSLIPSIKESAEEAVRCYYSTNNFDESKFEFVIHDRWAPRTDEELVTNFDLDATLKYGYENYKHLNAQVKKVKEAYKKSWFLGKFVVWLGPKKVDTKQVAELISKSFFDYELERIIQYEKNNPGRLSERARYVFDAVCKYKIKGMADN